MPVRTIPPPPRPRILALAGIALICFIAGYMVSHRKHTVSSGSSKPATATTTKPGGMVNVEFLVPTREGASKLKAEYESQGYHPTLNPIQSEVQVQSGFIVTD